METIQIREVVPTAEKSLQVSPASQICALSKRYADKGLAKAVANSAAEQIEKEETTRALAPSAYRLSQMSEGAVNCRYRLGKKYMTTSDLVRYFSETRAERIQNTDFGVVEASDAQEAEQEQALTPMPVQTEQTVVPLRSRVKSLSIRAVHDLRAAIPTWFDAAKPDTSSNSKRFPLSAFASVAAIAMSLMLIVASSILLTRAESNVNRMKAAVSDMSVEVSELKADLEVRYDLLEIRRIAIEEYGMVDEDYLKMQYISLRTEDTVEVFKEEREESVGLSALLSAMGMK